MNNLTEELAAVNEYSASMRFFTVGMETSCGRPYDCSKPFRQLNPEFDSEVMRPCKKGGSCRQPWAPANTSTLGDNGGSWVRQCLCL